VSVKSALLAILDQGPSYGNQLRAEFERRTGGTWPVNVGQIYTTLDRLERDGLATKGAPDAAGHIPWSITPAGSVEARTWLTSAVDRPLEARDELAIKLALAMTLPGADAASLIAAQRETTAAAAARWRTELTDDVARRLVIDFAIRAADAELAWLDHCESALASTRSFPIASEPPKRGRPTR
jgi:DNA-binding PadR family transcriptional regulator